MSKYLLLFSFFALSLAGNAQRAFKSVKVALKENKYKDAINQISTLRKDSTYRDDIKLCLYSIEANRGLNDAQNVKLYLKQSYDTVSFFSTTRNIIEEAAKIDSLERCNSLTNEGKPKQSRFVKELLQLYFPNLNAGARFFFKHQKYEESLNYLRLCLDLPNKEIGRQAGLPTKAEKNNACLYLISAFHLKRYEEVHRYEDLALRDSLGKATILMCLAQTAESEKDSARYKEILERGWKESADPTPFFTRLADFYTSRKQPHTVLQIAKMQLQRDSTDRSALFAQLMANLSLQKFDDCIEEGKQLLLIDSTNVETPYYIGAAYVGKADSIVFPARPLSSDYKKKKRVQTDYYKQAAVYLEQYRSAAPEQAKRWAPLLYKIYLSINDGKKFAEIEQILHSLK